ncbi:MAG TPA: MBL fold metallo-hydrolase [Roseiflexaceae bacterium]|nr:MBL fold metallo-hydrolase [Roseiflexaceae bacterium]
MQIFDTVTLVPNAGWDPRILVCRCGTLVDTFIVVTERYVVLVDTLINPSTAAALLEIARPHLASRQLLAVNTHADWDHAWGNQLFAGPGAAHTAPILATRRCAERLRSERERHKLANMQAGQPGRFDDVLLTPPTVLFDERLAIEGGDLTLDLFATPGHRPDHIAVFIPEIGTLLPGDAAELPFPFVDSAESLPAMRDSLARMDALRPATALYCHAPVDSGPGLLRQNMAYFDTVDQRCRAALARGVPANLDGADVEALVEFSFAEALPAGADAQALEGFYRPGHQAALRAMLEHLTAGS